MKSSFGYPKYNALTWNGLVAPARTPKEIIDRVAMEVTLAIKDPKFAERFASYRVDPLDNTPTEFAKMTTSPSGLMHCRRLGSSNSNDCVASMTSDRTVVIAGGGPVGVVSALALAQQGIAVRVFEAADRVDESPRASTTHPATLEMLAALGLLDEVIARGLVARTFQFWDRPSHRMIAEFDHAFLKDDTPYPFVVQCEQHKLSKLVIERLRELPNANVRFSARVDTIKQFNDRVEIVVETAQGRETVTGSYLIGADGGRSMVRKALSIEFEGYTFPERFLVLTTPVDFTAEIGVGFRNYFSDPDEWANLFKVSGEDGSGLWRVVFPTVPGETDEQVLSNVAVQRRLQKFFPRSAAYPITHRNIYNVNQRVAAKFQSGRVFLAGDAAHVNNPIGGLGLNCGVHDATEVAALLGAVIKGEMKEDALARYDARRRPMNIEYVQQQTIANKKRLEEKDAGGREANFAFLRKTAADPVAHRAFLLRTSLLESVRKQAPITA
jgi:3-(3-hydroxy-phenyl)propionate hydroxylase